MAKNTPLTNDPNLLAFTVVEFCQRHSISRSLFYKLVKNGSGPAIKKAGRRTLITCEDAADWRSRL